MTEILMNTMMTPISLFLLTMAFATGRAQETVPYQPECRSMDDIISQITTLPGSTCDKIDQCSGVACSLSILGQSFRMRMRLFPCEDPPQMRVLVTGSGVNFEETVTHNSSYTVPGLTFPLPFGSSSGIRLMVHFIPRENDGVVDGVYVGMSLRLQQINIVYPLFPDTLIRTPPCMRAPDFCDRFGALAEHVPSPNSCAVKQTCDGLDCSSTHEFYLQDGGSIKVEVDKSLTVKSCSTPISFAVTAKSLLLNLDWQHTFNESDTVTVDQPLTYGSKLVVSVSMTPLLDLENILATINYTLTAPTGIARETLLDNSSVPIPECRNLTFNPMTSPPQNHSECASWKNIENSLEFDFDQYAVRNCVTLPGCTGFNCTAIYDGKSNILLIEEFHCADPPYILVTIDGQDEHFTQNFTHNESVPLEPGSSANLTVHLVPVTPTSIYVGAYVDLASPAGPVRIPLIEDQLLEVSECEDASSTLTPTDKLRVATKRPGKNDTPKAEEQSAISGGIGMLWTILLAVFAAIVIGIACIALFLIIRQRNRSLDSTFLMEDRASMSSEYAM